LALDEPKNDDQRVDHLGVPFVVGSELHLWLRLGRELHVAYTAGDDRFTVRMTGPSCG
jgi:hypothetical protein